MNRQQFNFIKGIISKGSWVPGIDNIAEQLIECGECVVAGNGQIWHAEMAQFISAEPAPNAVGFSLLKLNLPKFLASEAFRDKAFLYIGHLNNDQQRLRDVLLETQREISSIAALTN